MGICETRVNEGYIPGSPRPELLEGTNLAHMENYICRIHGNNIIGTGFFCKLEYNNKKIPVLMTNYHVIDEQFLRANQSLKVDIKNNEHIININQDSIIYSSPKNFYDIIIIKINKNNKDIKYYLDIDPNIYKEESLSTYKNERIYVLHYPGCKNNELYPIPDKAYISYGNGIEKEEIENRKKYDIKHKCNTENGSSGAPILSSLTNKVMGIHKGHDKNEYNKKIGTFLKFPLNELNKQLINDLKNKKNYIITEIYIKEEDINKEIRILNSYEEHMREKLFNFGLKEECMNENEINKCRIEINGETIPFAYYHKFTAKGNYTIKYYFENYLTKTNQMFFRCSTLISINLSNFNSENVTNMSEMFFGCSSLINLDLSNFNTENVTNMEWMFSYCSSLNNLNLSSFNTQDVISMNSMFEGCSSLINLDLSNFNTENVKEMICMFNKCSSLINIDLSKFNTENVTNLNGIFLQCSSLINLDISNFNTQNVTDMYYMFGGCSSLKNIDLSNFRTHNVLSMSGMFFECSSLTELDLSSFNTQNVTSMYGMFAGCSSLKKLDLSNFKTRNVFDMWNIFNGCSNLKIDNIITHDIRIMVEFKKYHFN